MPNERMLMKIMLLLWYSNKNILISLFHRAFQFTIYNGPTNALVCNKTVIEMSHIKTLQITPKCFDNQMIIIRELFDPG
jgi:hypothetical protein